MNICDYFGFVFLNYCVVHDESPDIPSEIHIFEKSRNNEIDFFNFKSGGYDVTEHQFGDKENNFDLSHENSFQYHTKSNHIYNEYEIQEKFEVSYQWQYLNYTWPSYSEYYLALKYGLYIPENNAPTGLKVYKGKMYLSIPRFRPGIPATLAYIDTNEHYIQTNELLKPFPSWELNKLEPNYCGGLQSVQSMEIDTKGIMWVIDGVRMSNETRCPAKLVLLDLHNNGDIVLEYVFPKEIALSQGGFLNDIVIDETDGDYAYITDNSNQDPGLIVYSKDKNNSWKLRDTTMYAEINAVGFVVNKIPTNMLSPIDGIALSPKRKHSKSRTLYYSALTGFNMYSIKTSVLKNVHLLLSDPNWRKYIKFVGRKQAQSDGLMMDNRGNLYYTLLPLNGVGKWNTKLPFVNSKIVDQNSKTMIWPDGFAFDNDNGYLYLISNNINKFINASFPTMITSEVQFRVHKVFTGTKSYLH